MEGKGIMASVTITIAAGGEAGAVFRRLAKQIEKAAANLPDRNPTGASTVLTIDNALGSHAGVSITGPIASSTTFLV